MDPQDGNWTIEDIPIARGLDVFHPEAKDMGICDVAVFDRLIADGFSKMNYTNTPGYTGIKLSSVEHCSRWFEVLKQTAEGQNIWHKVDLDVETEPESPDIEVLEQITITVYPGLHSSTPESIRAETGRRQVSLREIAKKLKESFSPGLMVGKHQPRQMDRKVEHSLPELQQKAVRQDIKEIEGSNAIQDFIQAVDAQFEPTWAEARKVKMVEYNNDLPDHFTLKAVAEEFMRYGKAVSGF
ncbi:hypothetical protein E4U61_007329 [Claviceps capensis]|nr:hypothetical protein E4U61_007329 [Claviceps capensis]